METYGRVSPQEAAEALETAQRSRARVTWSGYPWWYWVATGAGLGAMAYAVALPGWWVLAFAAVVAPALYAVARVACRARGVCEGWRGAMTPRETAVLYGPEILLMLANAPVLSTPGGRRSRSPCWCPRCSPAPGWRGVPGPARRLTTSRDTEQGTAPAVDGFDHLIHASPGWISRPGPLPRDRVRHPANPGRHQQVPLEQAHLRAR